MKREQITRDDFPSSDAGYDRASVDAHLEAVAALATALEAQVKALEIERGALLRQIESAPVEPSDASSSQTVAASGPSAAETESPKPAPVSPGDGAAHSDEEVSARLVATRLVLDGASKERIREKLAETFDLEDADSLIDDVLRRLN